MHLQAAATAWKPIQAQAAACLHIVVPCLRILVADTAFALVHISKAVPGLGHMLQRGNGGQGRVSKLRARISATAPAAPCVP